MFSGCFLALSSVCVLAWDHGVLWEITVIGVWGLCLPLTFLQTPKLSFGSRGHAVCCGELFCDEGSCEILDLPCGPCHHLAFIPVSLGYQPGYWQYCVFSPKCLHPVNLWQLRTWIGRQERRLPCEPACHPAFHLKPRCRPTASLGVFVLSSWWVGGCMRGCVYSKWGWELLKNIGRKLRAEGCVRKEKDQPHPRLWPSALPMSPQPRELVWWPLDSWWTLPSAPRAPATVAASVPGTNGLPILPFASSSLSGMPPHQPTQLSSPECWPPSLRSSSQDEMSLLSLCPQPLAHLNSSEQTPVSLGVD